LFVPIPKQKCALIIIAEGFEETETIAMLGLLRQAGVCVKSVGLTSGLISSAHGVCLMPDLTLTDLDELAQATFIDAVILPEGKQSLSRLEADPRVHRLLHQVIAQRGQIVTGHEGLRVLRAAAVWRNGSEELDADQELPVFLRKPRQPITAFIRDLIQRLGHPSSTCGPAWVASSAPAPRRPGDLAGPSSPD
jgi:hypothetical protein